MPLSASHVHPVAASHGIDLAPMGVVVAVTDQIRLAGVADITFTTATLAKQQQ